MDMAHNHNAIPIIQLVVNDSVITRRISTTFKDSKIKIV